MCKIVKLPQVELTAAPKEDGVEVVDLDGTEEDAVVGYDPVHPKARAHKQTPLDQPDETRPRTPTMNAEYNERYHEHDESKDTVSTDEAE
jgi:hypothetical protein